MHDVISHSKPTVGPAEAEAAAAAVRSGQVSAGERTASFERALADFIDVTGAVATSSGTAALFAALKALGVGPGHEVIVPSYVCTALLHAVWAAGAEPVVCDVAEHFNLSVSDARARLSSRTAAIILPHVFGNPAPVGEFARLGPPVIEDCAQAIGADVGGARAGSLGSVSVFSFYATKMMTTGEGGMLASRSGDVIERARDLIEYDKKHDARRRFNLKFNDIAAAVGLVQLARLPEFVERRRRIAAAYGRALSGIRGITLPACRGSVHFRYVVQVDDAGVLIAALASRGVMAARPVDPPLHRVTGASDCPNAERAWERSVSLPIYPSLTDAEADTVAAAVRECIS